jgi:hypothetical protein
VRSPNTEPNNTTGRAKLMEAVKNRERKKCCTANKQFFRKYCLEQGLIQLNNRFTRIHDIGEN